MDWGFVTLIIELDTESKKWIESKGSHLTVKIMEVNGCCSPDIQEIVAVPGKPKASQQFNEHTVENISVYIQKNIKECEKLILKLAGFGFLKSISAKIM